MILRPLGPCLLSSRIAALLLQNPHKRNPTKYEAGDSRLDLIELHHVAKALGTTVQTILERMEL
jgi:hypothetical protein